MSRRDLGIGRVHHRDKSCRLGHRERNTPSDCSPPEPRRQSGQLFAHPLCHRRNDRKRRVVGSCARIGRRALPDSIWHPLPGGRLLDIQGVRVNLSRSRNLRYAGTTFRANARLTPRAACRSHRRESISGLRRPDATPYFTKIAPRRNITPIIGKPIRNP
jgi:hypothetical protein